MERRLFLKRALAGSALATAAAVQPGSLWSVRGAAPWRADLFIAGGGLGGCAAALAALRGGLRVTWVEEGDWIGGQSTAQAVPPDEHPWIESFGCTRSYRQYREAIRSVYRSWPKLTPAARQNPRLNPGNGWVSRLCHEPRVSLQVLNELFASYLSSGQLQLWTEHRVTAVMAAGDVWKSVAVRNLRTGGMREIEATYYIDATELGDLLPLGGVEHAMGAESRKETGEAHAPELADPLNQQAITCCFAIDYLEGEDHTLERPAEYGFWRDYVPKMRPTWPGKLLSWETSDPVTLKPRSLGFDPTPRGGGLNLWSYRRLVDPANFAPGAYRSGVCLVNWPQNDYWLGPLVGVTPEEAANHVARAKELSRSLLYWMQTEAPRPDGGTGWKGLRLRPDVVGTEDGMARQPYVRESRRIRAEFTVVEHHVTPAGRSAETGRPEREITTGKEYADSVGVGAYRIDLHPSTAGDNYVDLSCLPFQIPLGALIPRRVENVLAGAKNLGVTHLTNGAYRLHPVEWNVGEAAGALAAFCVRRKLAPRQVRNDGSRLKEFQAELRDQGFELEWPRLRAL